LQTNPNLSPGDRKELEDLHETVDKEIYDRAMAESRERGERENEEEKLETIVEENEGDIKGEEETKKGTKRSLGSPFQDDFAESKENIYDDDDKKTKKPRNE
jgi:hypothetical protein